MKYSWFSTTLDLLQQSVPYIESVMYQTSSNFTLNQKGYINEKGYVQKRKTENCIGRCIYSGRNLSFKKQVINITKVKRIVNEQYITGTIQFD